MLAPYLPLDHEIFIPESETLEQDRLLQEVEEEISRARDENDSSSVLCKTVLSCNGPVPKAERVCLHLCSSRAVAVMT